MEFWLLILAGLALTLVVGAICGLVAISRIGRLRGDIEGLTRQVQWLRRQLADRTAASSSETTAALASRDADASATEAVDATPPVQAPADAASTPETSPRRGWRTAPAEEDAATESVAVSHATRIEPAGPSWIDRAADHLRDNWMTWLGGGCVSLAGIFLVRYSMDQGWLGPVARIVAALLTGAALLGVSEYLRQRHDGTQPALAALAGGGCITLYGALFAAVKLYALISPPTAFVAMAIVGIGTMALALLHGPVLAAFGMLGAYLVPILVSTGGGQIVIALFYALIITFSALLLMRYVYRDWLWWGAIAGALGWWLISLEASGADGTRTLYLTAIAWLVAALPSGDWLLRTTVADEPKGDGLRAWFAALDRRRASEAVTYLLLALATGVSIIANPDVQFPWLAGLPFFVFSFWLARGRPLAVAVPWLTMIACIVAWLVANFAAQGGAPSLAALDPATANGFLVYLFVFAVAAATGSLWLFALGRHAAVWASLATLGPMLLLTLAYVMNLRPDSDVFWGLCTAVFALVYLTVAGGVLRKRSVESLVVWLFVGGHFGLAIAAAMVFESASLTLAIAAQAVSLAWVIRSFGLPTLGWLLKLVIAIVITRLTFNPWLPAYPTDVHWSLWTYGGSALMAALAAYGLTAYPALRRWAEGAALHLAVLTVWSEVRYQLYDGAVYAAEFRFVEALVMMALTAAMGLVYWYRARVSESLAWLYRVYAYGLALAGLALYAVILMQTLASDPWIHQGISARPLANAMLAAYGVPVAAGALYALGFDPRWRRAATVFTGGAAFVFVSLQIRHLWSGTVRLDRPSVDSGELYTYSAVWLVIAIATMLAGSWRFGQPVYRAGLALLGLVIAKLFLVDLSDLDGLLRVASFMGLGLSLLGVAYLHQRLGAKPAQPV